MKQATDDRVLPQWHLAKQIRHLVPPVFMYLSAEDQYNLCATQVELWEGFDNAARCPDDDGGGHGGLGIIPLCCRVERKECRWSRSPANRSGQALLVNGAAFALSTLHWFGDDDEPDDSELAANQEAASVARESLTFPPTAAWDAAVEVNEAIGLSLGWMTGSWKCLVFVNCSRVTSIGHHFLYDCRCLTAVDLSALSKVTSVGNYFLGFCRSLTAVSLYPLSNVTSIGHDFLSACRNLNTVDFSPLSKVTSVGEYFLCGCPANPGARVLRSLMPGALL